MFAFFKRRAVLLVLGFLLIALFVWFAGPYFAFGTYRPLESEIARLIAIALIVGCWLGSVLVKRLRARRANDKLVAAVIAQSQPQEARPPADVLKLRERFEEAVATLKQRRTGHSLYDLPWYMIIGAPGAGKTTALLNSGLKFPLEQRGGKGALRGVGGTRNCDWWFTDEAVFLDTAGRYTTQDSDAASDSAGWSEFLALLSKYRERRPVNGVILTISAQDLLTQADAGREAHIEAARQRLRELDRELRIQLPVYVMVTKCDLVAGFTEYFDDLTQETRAQVWGVTFPYERTQSDDATQAFPEEFDALIGRLNARLFARIEEDRDVRRRTKVFAFPQQMAALRDLLSQFLTEVFASARFDQPVLLRGVYFTSGTQEGTPIDRLLGAVGRRFGVAADAVAPPAGRGKAYFMERLLKEVLIGESGLAGVNRRLEMRKAGLQLGAYAAMALVAVVGIIALSVSYSRNRAYVAEVGADVAALDAVPAVPVGAPLGTLLPRLNAIRAVVDSADRYRSDTPWTLRWGLYQGGSVGNAARDAYLRELDGLVLPRFAARMKARLIEYAPEPDKLYEYLKAYLMLAEPKHLDKMHLQSLADLEWNTATAPGGQGASLAKHFQSLLEYGETLRPISVDAALVAQARSTVRQASIPKIMYGGIKRQYADTARTVHLDVAAGLGIDKVLKRKSGVSLAEPFPSLYTRPIFKEVTGRGTTELLKTLSADDWVWGGSGLSVDNPVKLAGDVIGIYEQDYIAAWDGLLDDLELVPFSTLPQTIDALGILAGSTSPLRGLLRVVDDNTYLVESPDAGPPSGAVSAATSAVTKRLGNLLNSAKQATGLSIGLPGGLITAHFQTIHRLMAGGPGSAPIDKILAKIAQIQQQLKSVRPDIGGSDPLEILSSPALRDVLQQLQDEAASLPPLVAAVVAQIGHNAEGSVKDRATDDLEMRYREEVLADCKAAVAGRYPFTASSPDDVLLADFTRLFGPGALFDTFFKDNLEKFVDTSHSPWAWRPGAVKPSAGMLARFEVAQELREMFFSSGQQLPKVSFSVTLTDLDAAASRFVLQIDNQTIDDRHYSPPRKRSATWPASNPGLAAATFEDQAGAWAPAGFDGVWAWFRLIDVGKPQREADQRVVLSFQNSSHRARVIMEPASVRNPFTSRDWQHFSCGS